MTDPRFAISPEAAAIRRVRGSAIPMIIAAAKIACTRTAWRLLLEGFTPEARTLLEFQPPQDMWLDPRLVGEWLTRFQESLSLGPIPGIFGAETIRLRNPDAFRSPADLLASLPAIWEASVDGGVIRGEIFEPGTGVVRIWADWPVPYFFEVHLQAWLAQGLELAGASRATVSYVPPGEGSLYLHEYRLAWT